MADATTLRTNLTPLLDAFDFDEVYAKRLGSDGRFRMIEWAGLPPRGLDEHIMGSRVGLGGYVYATRRTAVTNRYHADGRFAPQDLLVMSGLDHLVCCHREVHGSVTLVYGGNYRREIAPVAAMGFSQVVARAPDMQAMVPGGTGARVSPRERTILYLVSHGFEDREIAEMLFVSPATIRFHLRHLQAKFGCRNRTHLATEALRQGLLS